MENEIGIKLKSLRLSRGMTQKELAEKCGMKDSAVRKYERGTITPKLETISRLADGLGVPVTQIIDVNKQNLTDIFDSINAQADREFIERLSSLALNLNRIGREKLLEQASLLQQERYTEKNINALVKLWDPAALEYYGVGLDLQVERHIRDLAGDLPEYMDDDADDDK